MNEKLVSLIVPVYRNPDLFRPMLESVLSQSYQNMEVLLIDDGSPDGCDKICDEAAEIDNRVRVFHLENSGVSSARNFGLNECRGDFVTFADSDDLLSPHHVETLVDLMMKTEADIVSTSMVFYLDHQIAKPYEDMDEISFFTPSEALKSIHMEKEFNGYVMNKMFLKELISDLRFESDIHIHEDMLFLWNAILKSKRIAFSTKHTYHYLCHTTSAMNQTFSEKYESAIIAAEKMLSLSKANLPELFPVVNRTVLFSILSVANKRAYSRQLSSCEYKRLKDRFLENFDKESIRLIFGIDNRISCRMFLLGRTPFLLWKKIVSLLKKIRK